MERGRPAPPPGAGRRPRLRGVDRAEEAVGLVIRAGGEEQPAARSGGVVVPELERPQAVDRDRPAVAAAQLAAVLELPVRQLGIGVDLAVAEVADEEIAAEATE